jgi:hypothetical protein
MKESLDAKREAADNLSSNRHVHGRCPSHDYRANDAEEGASD